jgi:hypothetical protein
MAETQEKRTDASTPGNATGNDVKNQANNPGQSNKPAGNGGSASGSGLPDPKEILKQAKDTAGQAYEKVTEQASSTIITQKDNLAHGLSSVADGIRQMGESLRGAEQQTPIAGFTAKYGDSLAQQVENVSNYLEKKDIRDLVRDVEVFARRNPAVFIGGAFALGIAAARFLKSGNPNQSLMRRPRHERGGVYIPDKSEGVYLPEDLSKKVGLTDASAKTSTSGSTGSSSGTGSASSSTDRTSSDAFSTNKGG